jgi:hypothetical protein
MSIIFLSVTASCQDSQKPASAPQTEMKTFQAPISCTANVPSAFCKAATMKFSFFQQISRLVGQVEFVIADADSFKNEQDRLNARFANKVKTATTFEHDTDKLLKVINRKPVAPSVFSDSVLFVLDEEGLRGITKVVVSIDMFREVKSSEKLTVDKNNVVRFQLGDFDPNLLETWSQYISGYIEGWNMGRLMQAAERM